MLSGSRVLFLATIGVFLFLPHSTNAADANFMLRGQAPVDECWCGIGDPNNNGLYYDVAGFDSATTPGSPIAAKSKTVPLMDGTMASIDDLMENSTMDIPGFPVHPNCTDILDDPTNDKNPNGSPANSDPPSLRNTDPTICFCGEDDPQNGPPPMGVSCTGGTIDVAPDGTCSATTTTACAVDGDCPGVEQCIIHGICGGTGNNGQPCEVAADCPNPAASNACRLGCTNADSVCFCPGDGAVDPTGMPWEDNADCSLLMNAAMTADCVPADTCQEKRNQSYVWGQAGDFVGTIANTACQVVSGLGGFAGGMNTPGFSDVFNIVCEGADSQFPHAQAVSDVNGTGDHRPPEIFYVPNLAGQELLISAVNGDTVCGAGASNIIRNTVGWRSGGSFPEQDIAFLAGPNFQGGISVAAIQISTRDCLGMTRLTQFNNIRKWVSAFGHLYTSVGNTDGNGSVLKWTGNLITPFQFQVVGNLDAGGANMAVCNGRIVLTTWPNLEFFLESGIAGLPTFPGGGGIGGFVDIITAIINFLGVLENVGEWEVGMSPVVPPHTGLTPADAGNWNTLIQSADYETNWINVISTGGGGIACNGEEIITGTMEIPFSAELIHILFLEPDLLPCVSATGGCNPACITELCTRLALVTNNRRPAAVFRIREFGSLITSPVIELLFGSANLQTYAGSLFEIILAQTGLTTLAWHEEPNNLGLPPVCGGPGFGDNNILYLWTASACNGDDIFVGDLDLSGTGSGAEGGDLYKFTDGDGCAVQLAENGGGTTANYGFRTGSCVGGNMLILGTASDRNLSNGSLATGTDRNVGGWEVLELNNFN